MEPGYISMGVKMLSEPLICMSCPQKHYRFFLFSHLQ